MHAKTSKFAGHQKSEVVAILTLSGRTKATGEFLSEGGRVGLSV
jgi:hypothetical protein